MAESRPRRLIWVVNHRTLLPAEIPIFLELGYEVFIPKIVPSHDPAFRSSVVTFEYDATLSLPAEWLALLNGFDFYQSLWTPEVTQLINDEFDVVVSSVSLYTTPLAEAARHFQGTLIARVFGREVPRNYTEFFYNPAVSDVLRALAAMGDRFVFGQGFDALSTVEAYELISRAHTITVPLPRSTYDHAGSWRGDGDNLVFLCPQITWQRYYTDIYEGIKAEFGDLPHVIFGRQTEPVDDPHVLPFLDEQGLYDLYAETPAFVYPSTEPRHVHYSPIEAMVVGAPVLYRAGGLIDTLAGRTLPGACASAAVMRTKAERLLAGDAALREDIKGSQQPIVDSFSIELAARQWAEVLAPVRARS
jgi:hypothetical protein